MERLLSHIWNIVTNFLLIIIADIFRVIDYRKTVLTVCFATVLYILLAINAAGILNTKAIKALRIVWIAFSLI